jgi:phosphatidylglycerophosphatase A
LVRRLVSFSLRDSRRQLQAVELAAIALLFAVGVWSASRGALKMVDPGPVVIDEVVGVLITLALLPVKPGCVPAFIFASST